MVFEICAIIVFVGNFCTKNDLYLHDSPNNTLYWHTYISCLSAIERPPVKQTKLANPGRPPPQTQLKGHP